MSDRSPHTNDSDLLAATMDALPLPVLVHDYDHVVYANAAAARVLGAASAADLAGLALDTFLVPELAGVVKERRAYLLRDQLSFSGLPIKMRGLDGREIRITVDARPIRFEDRTIGLVTLAG